jgi:hypothetical protein
MEHALVYTVIAVPSVLTKWTSSRITGHSPYQDPKFPIMALYGQLLGRW